MCDDDFTDKSDSESDSEDDYSESEVDEEGNLRDFISDDIEYTDYSSTEEQKLIEAFTQPILAAIKPNLIIHFTSHHYTHRIRVILICTFIVP